MKTIMYMVTKFILVDIILCKDICNTYLIFPNIFYKIQIIL